MIFTTACESHNGFGGFTKARWTHEMESHDITCKTLLSVFLQANRIQKKLVPLAIQKLLHWKQHTHWSEVHNVLSSCRLRKGGWLLWNRHRQRQGSSILLVKALPRSPGQSIGQHGLTDVAPGSQPGGSSQGALNMFLWVPTGAPAPLDLSKQVDMRRPPTDTNRGRDGGCSHGAAAAAAQAGSRRAPPPPRARAPAPSRGRGPRRPR